MKEQGNQPLKWYTNNDRFVEYDLDLLPSVFAHVMFNCQQAEEIV